MLNNSWTKVFARFRQPSHKTTKKTRTPRRQPTLETLEDRAVPAAFVSGTIQGQDGWTGGTIAIAAAVDQGVDQGGSNAHAGVGSWRVSNSTVNGNHNGAFSGWPFSPGLAVTAGQPSSGAGADRFVATFFFKAGSAVADGSNIEVDLGSSLGDDRNTFFAITNDTDGDGGLKLRMAEPDGATGDFHPTQIVATNLSRTDWHRIDIVANFLDGSANDTFQVSLDGVALTNPLTSGTTFGTFEGFFEGVSSPYVQSNRLFFRSGAAASAFDASFVDNAAQGFYIDDVSYSVSIQANPSVALASYAATFEPAGTTSATVYVDDSWAGTPVGVDPDGAGPAGFFGYDAFATIQEGVNVASVGGTVHVAAGTYAENVVVDKSLALLGPNAGINPNTGMRGAEAIVVPAAVETSLQASTSGTVFRVGSGLGHIDVTIDGFLIDGHNASLTGGRVLNGVEVHTGAGIINSIGSFDADNQSYDTTLTVQNNIIQNLERYGVWIGNEPSNAPKAGSDVSFNKIDNLPSGNNFGGDRGRGVAFGGNVYGSVTNNVMTRVNVGWQNDNFFLASPGAGTLVDGNEIHTYHRGIFHNLQYGNATAATISNNTIFVETDGDFPASATNFGIELASIMSGVGATVTDNDVTGTVHGILLWNLPTTGTITVSGGTLTGNQFGILATNNDPQFGAGDNTSAVVSGVTIVNATGAGIFVQDHPAGLGTVALIVEDGTSVTGSPIGIDVDAGSAAVDNTTITANGTGIRVTNGGSLTSLTENFITANTGDGLLITATAGSVAPIFGNDLSGNTGLGVNNLSATLVNAAGNWWGTSTPAGVAAEVSANADFTPWLGVGTDTSAAVGFQGSFANLFVDDSSPQSGVQGRIAEGISLVTVGGTVNVAAGTYAESVTVNKAVNLLGAQNGVDPGPGRTAGGAAESVIQATGGAAFDITANGVTVSGFSVTAGAGGVHGIAESTPVTGTTVRENFVFGFTGSLGVAIAAGSTGFQVSENEVFNNYAGIYLSNGAFGGAVLSNVIRDHTSAVFTDAGSGVVLEGVNPNVTVTENVITGNRHGVYVWTGFGSNLSGTLVVGNNISGNTAGVNNTNAAVLDAGGNWWGSATGPTVASNPTGIGNVILDGGAQVDYSPWLSSDMDLSSAFGFQADFSDLIVNANSPRNAAQVLAGANNIQDGIDLAAPGGTVVAQAGTYTGSVDIDKAVTLAGDATIDGNLTASAAGATIDPGVGTDAGVFTVNGNLNLQPGSVLSAQIGGTTVGTNLDRVNVNGAVNLNGGVLDADLSFATPVGSEIVLLSNDAADTVTGTFAGLPEGATVPINGQQFRVSYTGGDGNDVSLALASTPPTLFNVTITPNIQEGGTATVTGTIADPDLTDTFTLRVFWGDGQSSLVNLPAGSTSFAVSHQYTTDGTFPVFVALTDASGGTAVATAQVSVADTGITATVRYQKGRPRIDVRSAASGALLRTIAPFGNKFRGRVRIAVGDVTGDLVQDIVVIKERGTKAVLRVFDGATGELKASFRPFAGGVNAQFFLRVAAFDNDGRNDVFVTAVSGGVVRTRVFSGASFQRLASLPGLPG